MINQVQVRKSLKQLMRLKYAFVFLIHSDGNVEVRRFVNKNDAYVEFLKLEESLKDELGKNVILVYLSDTMEYVLPTEKHLDVSKLIDALLDLFS